MNLKEKGKNLFHPYEVFFCGYSGSGKTTLISKLIKSMQAEFNIGYVKHDAHQFQMDQPGKDTYRMWESGAENVFISDSSHSAMISRHLPNLIDSQFSMQSNDILFIEGYKSVSSAKIVILDQKNEIINLVSKNEISHIIAFVGEALTPPKGLEQMGALAPYFQRDEIHLISDFIKNHLLSKAFQAPLYGLVLTGGQSRRMESDKALLKYHDKSQAEIGFDLLSQYCVKTFISSRSGQRTNQIQAQTLNSLPQIFDQFLEVGPLGGILSAQRFNSKAAWLVIACDLPFLDAASLEYLIKKRDPFKFATCFQSVHDLFPEPLCAIYEPKSYARLLQFLGLGYECPRKALINSSITMLAPIHPQALDNVNKKEEFHIAQNRIAQKKMLLSQSLAGVN